MKYFSTSAQLPKQVDKFLVKLRSSEVFLISAKVVATLLSHNCLWSIDSFSFSSASVATLDRHGKTCYRHLQSLFCPPQFLLVLLLPLTFFAS